MISLEDLVSTPDWEALQDSISRATGLSVITVKYDGRPVTKHSGCSSFCAKVRKDPELAHLCQECDARAGFEALRSGKPFIYFCHLGIIDIAVPLIIDHQYLGNVMAGQVKLDEASKHHLLQLTGYDKTTPATEIPDIESEKTIERIGIEDYEDMPVLTYQQIVNFTDMIKSMCTFMCHQKTTTIAEIDKLKILSSNPGGEAGEASPDDIILRQKMEVYTNGQYKFFSPPLKSAIEYLFSGLDHFPTLNETASECGVTPSYLSRLFSAELHMGYNVFITRIKMEQAKYLLENTNYSVNEIGDMLNYDDPGYFIKVFKKNAKVTPFAYRRLIRNR